MKTYFPDPLQAATSIAKEFPSLSRRQIQVCFLVANRLSTTEIARCLSLRPRTVEKHIENAFRKLRVRSREQLRLRLGVLPFPKVPDLH